jgi:hypothetical protein
MFTVLGYSRTAAGAETDIDMTAMADQEFVPRNSHYMMTNPYRLGAAVMLSTTAVRAAFSAPSWNAFAKTHLWPVNKSANVPSPPQMQWMLDDPPRFPVNEEFQVLSSVGGAETAQVFLWVLPDDWSANLPPGKSIGPVRITAAPTAVANAWATPVALTFEQALQGGVYSVIGAMFSAATMTCARLVFPRSRMYRGQRLRPGILATNAIGDKEEQRLNMDRFTFGEWGRFHTFEPPSLEVCGNTAGALAVEGRLWLKYLGTDMSALTAWAASGN